MTRPPDVRRLRLADRARAIVNTLRLCLLEARPSVLAIFALRYAAGAVLGGALGYGGNLARAIACAIAWELAIFFAYLINGVLDVREDQVNQSSRPIARGELAPAAARRVALGAAAAALAVGLTLGTPTAWAVPVMLALGYLYSGPPWYLKRSQAGATGVVTIAGLLTYYAGFAANAGGGRADPGQSLFLFAMTMSLWMGLIGATTKDFSDVAGDATAGRRTRVVAGGEPRARIFVSAGAAVLATAFLTTTLWLLPSLASPALILAGGAVAVAIVTLSRLSHGNRARRRLPYRVFMLTQYSVHLGVVLPAVACLMLGDH
jgi:4-hydroxybenzoate polyprenyltransferase